MADVATVFGGSGFIGRYVVQRLARAGKTVRIAVRDTERAHFLKTAGGIGQIVPLHAPVTDDAAVARAVAGADWVVYLVGILAESRAASFQSIHVDGAARVARAAASAGVKRLIHVSAIGADPDSDSRYAASKGEGEAAVRAAFPGATILRPSIVFGPEDNFFNRFAVLALYLPALPLIGGGMTRFQPVYVGDVADAAVAALDRHEAPGRIYQLGGPRIYTFKELMELMLREIRRRRALI